MSFQSVIISVIGQPPILNCCIYRGGEEKHFLKHKSYIIHIAQVISLAILMRRGHGNFSNHIRKSHCSIAQTCILSKSPPVKILSFAPSLSLISIILNPNIWAYLAGMGSKNNFATLLEHGLYTKALFWSCMP